MATGQTMISVLVVMVTDTLRLRYGPLLTLALGWWRPLWHIEAMYDFNE